MAKKQHTQPATLDPTDIRYYLHQPHDKYVRAILQLRTSAMSIIGFALDEFLRDFIDMDTLLLTNNSFIDEKLQLNLADICYEGETKSKVPFRICLLFEHKSAIPTNGLYEQLNRYINNVWLEDQKQNRTPTLSIPILIYHGETPIAKVRPASLFPHAPTQLLRFVPSFDYLLVDIAALSEQDIEKLDLPMLKNIFFALKFSRNEIYLRTNWKKIIIFASDSYTNPTHRLIIKYTLLYMISVSKTIQEAFENPSDNMTVQEEELLLPYVFEKYKVKYREEGLQEGKEEGLQQGLQEGLQQGLQQGLKQLIQKFIKKNPDMSDNAVAEYLEVAPDLVQAARQEQA